MKFRSLHKWNNEARTTNFIFFAQILEEMLFNYTIDTYKPSVMDTNLLIDEALKVIAEVENGNINEGNIKHVIDELCNTLDKDMVANELIPLPKKQIFSILKDPKSNTNKVKNILRILGNSTNNIVYHKKLEEKITKKITDNDNNFGIIRLLARSYITSLISHGYHPYFIRKTMLDFFWNGSGVISSCDSVKEFFSKFSFKEKKYTVYVVVDKIFTLYESMEWLKFSSYEELPENIKSYKYNTFLNISNNEVFCIFTEVANIDPYSAWHGMENFLQLSANLINIFHHKKKPVWQNKVIVIDMEDNMVYSVNQSIPPMLRCVDLKTPKAEVKINNFIKGFSLDDHSFSKFINSTSLHAMALHSDSIKNQLLNLWVAIESLVPSETRDQKDANIQHITKSIIPFLNIVYLSNLIDNLLRDLIRWDFKITRKILKNIKGNNFRIKLVNLLSNDYYKSEFDMLLSKTKDFYLLEDRLKHFQSIFSSKRKIMETLNAHSKRLEWQIRRIYRTRNLIVHTGESPTYTATLIEHAHSYLDTIQNILINLASVPCKINSVTEGFDYMQLRYNFYLDNCCSSKDEKLTDEELLLLLSPM